jgi:hypothetical protein
MFDDVLRPRVELPRGLEQGFFRHESPTAGPELLIGHVFSHFYSALFQTDSVYSCDVEKPSLYRLIVYEALKFDLWNRIED